MCRLFWACHLVKNIRGDAFFSVELRAVLDVVPASAFDNGVSLVINDF